MVSGWTALSCIVALAVVVPMHLGLWLPLADRRLARESAPGRMSRRAAWLVFVATVGLHGLWTLWTSVSLTPAAGSLLKLTLANVLLAPFWFTVSYGAWLHWRILLEPNRSPWRGVQAVHHEDDLPSVTVVICCRNEPLDVVLMTLRSAQQLRYPRNKLAFLIADNSDEDHPDYLALCREVEAQRRGGEPIELLHRQGTQGFKAGNLDMALQVASSDLLLFLDVDNTVPGDLLLKHADSLWRDPGVAFHQCLHIACNGGESLVAAMAASVVGYGKDHDLALATFADWSFFMGHACIWKRRALQQAAPVSQYFCGKSILAEDVYVSFRASRFGLHGKADETPSAYWVPSDLDGFEKMLVRWHIGALQCYAKDVLFILTRSMRYEDAGRYIALWYRLWGPWVVWLIPVLAVLLPFSFGGAWLIVALWGLLCLMPPLLVLGLKADASVGGVNSSPLDLLGQHLLFLFHAWSHCLACILFVSGVHAGWTPTPKAAPAHLSSSSWLDVGSRFVLPLLFSSVVPGLALLWKGRLFGEPLLSPATLPLIYLSIGILIAIVLFAPRRRAPASWACGQRMLPSWMGRPGVSASRSQP
jgi:cellulose synthase/poly-beta-1,6-N-acetylglucosamine synthase-like glycosyltransferase